MTCNCGTNILTPPPRRIPTPRKFEVTTNTIALIAIILIFPITAGIGNLVASKGFKR